MMGEQEQVSSSEHSAKLQVLNLNVSLVPTHALVLSYTKITQNTFIKKHSTCFDLTR